MQFACMPELVDLSGARAPSVGPERFAMREDSPFQQRIQGAFEIRKKG